MVPWFIRRKHLNDPTLFLHFYNYPLWRGLEPSFWKKKWIPFMQESFVPSLIEIGLMFHFKRFFSIYKCTCVKIVPHLVPPNPRGTIICTKLTLHYVRKLWCKSAILAQWFSRKKINDLINFCIFVIISPLKTTWSFICTI
jgi:hypothetical protein